MRKIIEFTKKWKNRNLLHVIGGGLISLFLNLLGLKILTVVIITFLIGHIWEAKQVKYYKAKYSITDILLAIFGGLIVSFIFKYI